MPTPNEYKSPLLNAWAGHAQWLKVLIPFSAVINLLALTPSIYMLQVYDRVLYSQSQSTLLTLTLLVIALYVLSALLDHQRNAVLNRIGNSLEADLTSRLHTAAFQRALVTQGKDNTGQAIRDFNLIRQFGTSQGAIAFLDLPWVVLYVGLLFVFHPWFGIMALACIAVSLAMSYLHLRTNRHNEEHAQQLALNSAHVLNSTLMNTNSIQAMHLLPNIQQQWLTIQNEHSLHHTASMDANSRWTTCSKYFRLFVQSAALGLGAYLSLEHALTGGMMIAASILMGKALAPIDTLVGACKSLTGVRQAYGRLTKLFKNEVIIPDLHPLPEPKPMLEFKHVYVTAPLSERYVLKNIHLKIQAGIILGVFGPSGSGKTSLLHAVAGILPIVQGELDIDGANIALYPRQQLGPWTGYLAQHVELFEGTVAQNIARFQQDDPQRVIDAAQAAGVHELILKLPHGYDTALGHLGEGLSGGMRQRIGLARALYGRPRLLLLDEPNSNLDSAGEQALVKALSVHRANGHTAIVVSHKKALLKQCDRLLYINDGEPRLFGATDQVIAQLVSEATNNQSAAR